MPPAACGWAGKSARSNPASAPISSSTIATITASYPISLAASRRARFMWEARAFMTTDPYLQAAIEQARKSLSEGGIPIGSVLVHEDRIIGAGHNCRVQTGSAIDHGEMNCLRNAGRLPASIYQNSSIYSTLSPCPMCSGAMVLYKIPRVIVGENKNFLGAEDYMRGNGIQVTVLQ